MAKLEALEKRLKDEPGNLGLRVMVAGALFEAGRRGDAAALYVSVAIAYRDQGRPQQAIVVCRSLLELAPEDRACRALLASLTTAPDDAAPASRLTPVRRSPIDVTPLPAPLPYHVADPSSLSRPKLSRADLPPSLQREHAMLPELERLEGIEGIANAARQISAALLATRQQEIADEASGAGRHDETLESDPGNDPGDGDAGDVGDDELTLPPKLDAIPHRRGVDDEKTRPRERPPGLAPAASAPPTQATGPGSSALFAPVPLANRAAMLLRFRRRLAGIGTTVIRRGEAGHGLILVVRGRLDVHAEGADGARVSLEAIGPGDYVGEIGLVSRTPAAAYVVAAVDSELLVLAATDFYELAGELPALWTAVSEVAARRTRDHALRLQA